MTKRVFDLVLVALSLPMWLPVLLICALAVLVCEGRPVFYGSSRRVKGGRFETVYKFRTMVRHADKIANRDTIPVTDQRFLNLPLTSELYTPVGTLLERCNFTELPQLLHVVRGDMSLVGNRPLPASVIESLSELYPYVERRFATPCGLTGPSQLAGREHLSDEERLHLEATYCELADRAWTPRLDFMILVYTVLRSVNLIDQMSLDEIEEAIYRWSGQSMPEVELTEVATLDAKREVNDVNKAGPLPVRVIVRPFEDEPPAVANKREVN